MANIYGADDFSNLANLSGMMGLSGSSALVTNPYYQWVLPGAEEYKGASNLFGDFYQQHSASGIDKARTGLREMRQLNEYFNTTVRPEGAPEDSYLPFRPDGGDPNTLAGDIEKWHKYYSSNKDLRQYLSPDEQIELQYLDFRKGGITKEGMGANVEQILNRFGMEKQYPIEDWKAKISMSIPQKKQTDNPYLDLANYGGSIGGFWNPEGGAGALQDAASNPFVAGALTLAGGSLAGPWGAGLASAATTKVAGGSWEDALLSGAIAGISSGMAPGGEAAASGATSASQEFLKSALGQGLLRGGATLATGGSLQDALLAGGVQGLTTSGLLGGSVGLPGAASGVTYGDILKTAYRASQGDWEGVLSSIAKSVDLGQLGDYEFMKNLPESAQEALRKVAVADILTKDYGNILQDINNPFSMEGSIFGNLPNFDYSTPEGLKKIIGTATDYIDQLGLKIPNIDNPFSDVDYATPEWIKNAVGYVSDLKNYLPNGGDINNPFNGLDINIPSISLPSFGSGMLTGQQAPSDPYQKFYWDIGYKNPITV